MDVCEEERCVRASQRAHVHGLASAIYAAAFEQDAAARRQLEEADGACDGPAGDMDWSEEEGRSDDQCDSDFDL